MERKHRPLWRCGRCGRDFANANQSHACGTTPLAAHFEGRSAGVRAIYEAFLAMLEGFGPVIVLPEKTRIAFQVRMSFAQLTLRRDWAIGHFVLARRAESPLFTKIETISSRHQGHPFRLHPPEEGAAPREVAR